MFTNITGLGAALATGFIVFKNASGNTNMWQDMLIGAAIALIYVIASFLIKLFVEFCFKKGWITKETRDTFSDLLDDIADDGKINKSAEKNKESEEESPEEKE